jgi:hypothetical protein
MQHVRQICSREVQAAAAVQGRQAAALACVVSAQGGELYVALSQRHCLLHRQPAVPNSHATTCAPQAEGVKVSWKQTTDEVLIIVPIADGVRGKEVACEVHPKRLKLQVQGKPVLEGSLVDAGEVDHDGEQHQQHKRRGSNSSSSSSSSRNGSHMISRQRLLDGMGVSACPSFSWSPAVQDQRRHVQPSVTGDVWYEG